MNMQTASRGRPPGRDRGRTVLLSIALGLGATAFVICLLGVGLPARAAPAVEHQVCPSGCSYSSIQAAVDAADGGDVIKVAQGIYTDVHQRNSLTQVVYIDVPLTIRGGYTTSNGFADPPDPAAYPALLDAQRQGRVIYVAEHVTVTLEGLQLTGGDGSDLGGGTGTYDDAGGGFYAGRGANITISDCVIASNRSPMAGGGYVSREGTLTLQDSLITANVAISGSAGGVNLYYPSAATISRNTIASNTAGFNAGAIYVAGGLSDTVISRNTIVSNTAAHDAGGVFMASGATLRDNVLAHNRAEFSGGALYINGRSPMVASNKVFDNRAVNWGGGIYVSTQAILNANRIISNAAGLGGGGLFLYNSMDRFENNVVARNRIGDGRNGAGIYVWSGAPRLLHTTVAENVGGDGSGIYVGQFTLSPGSPSLTNTILVSETVGVRAADNNTVTLEATLWGSGAWANGTDAIGPVISSTNVTGDPAFVNPDGGDYHIQPSSDAIDTGIDAGVSVDLDGESRPAGAGYDLGADELWRHVYLPLTLRDMP
ncbi:MAG: right-handed parallel beta-helix repeat-containing protein [Chloroflexota bacterium]